MFEAVELGQVLDKDSFKAQEAEIRASLLQAQRELAEKNIPMLLIVAGVEGAGKGEVVDRLHKWFDSRNLETHAFWDETDEELERPPAWRFWKRLPPRGEIAIMFGGWYWAPLYAHASKVSSDSDIDEATRRINELEHMLYVDGMLIVKLWFHLSRPFFRKRMKRHREIEVHLHRRDKNRDRTPDYNDFLNSAERMIRHTDSGECPWQLIESDDSRFRDVSAARTILARIHQRLHEQRSVEKRTGLHPLVESVGDNPVTILDRVDLSLRYSKKEYDKLLADYQKRLHRLTWQAYDAKRSIVVVFEGWDAAGKGGAIRRITSAMDARLYRVISVAAPSDEEHAHHYLWRFWRQVPRAGYMTIYDRSWYGRVLVERVEGLAEPHEWMRSYREINDFEEQLTEHGTLLLKFWLHISNEEQLSRFKAREQTSWKKHKITEEDWRNREKWQAYWQAVNDMVEHTSTSNAPWTLVPANDKYYARIRVLQTICERLEKLLE
ncbi:MAG: polyphosphate:AMP phosphotransferase [Granulosicoccaceae bacterium]|jgi:polyphosphate:AMP phosphotransferase